MALSRSLVAVVAVAFLGLVGASVGCATAPPAQPAGSAGSGGSSGAGSSASVAVSRSGPVVTVRRDVRYAPAPEPGTWTDRVLDLYAPEGADGAPVAVLFTAHRTTKDAWQEYADLATALAERGVVVAVANWSQVDVDESTTAAVLDVVAQGRAAQGCAVAVAASAAEGSGGDASRLVLVGQFYGGNVAALTALAPPPAPLPGCAEARAPRATGLLVWDGDWVLGMDLWDGYGAGAARVAQSLTPWSVLPTSPHVPVVLAYSRNSATALKRCEAGTSPAWLAVRDPSGAMRRRLVEVGAFSDGCVDIGDEAVAMAAAMRSEGIPATVLALRGAVTSEEAMDPDDRARLVEAVVGLLAAA